MGVTIDVTGTGKFLGLNTNIVSYSVTEEAVSLDISDSSGGVGSTTFVVSADDEPTGSLQLLNDTFVLSDTYNGTTSGVISGVSMTDGVANITADSALMKLNIETTAEPYDGSLYNLFVYYLGLGGVTGFYQLEQKLENKHVSVQGWFGNLWVNLKSLLTLHNLEIALVSNLVVIREIRERIIDISNVESLTVNRNNNQLAQSVEVFYYNNVYKNDTFVYPAKGWSPDLTIFQADAGEVLEVDLPVDVSVTSVDQPICVQFVERDYAGSVSVYTIAGSDGLPIPPAQWEAQGGSVTVSIDPEDSKILKLRIVGASEEKYAPYRLAVASSPSDTYSTLRLIGDGTHFDRQMVSVATGADPAKATQKVGLTIDNIFVNTLEDAYRVGVRAAQKFAGSNLTISLTARVVHRRGEQGIIDTTTFADFNKLVGNQKFSAFNAVWDGKSFKDFNDTFLGEAEKQYQNQAFGNIAGALFRHNENMFRVRSATISETGITIEAEDDTTFANFNEVWVGKTFNDFNARFEGRFFQDFGSIVLWQ